MKIEIIYADKTSNCKKLTNREVKELFKLLKIESKVKKIIIK